jgi:D-xylose transport system substrate-binding protein
VSWNNFQQPRWAAADKPSMKKTIEAGGGTFIDKDANLKNVQQLTDIDTLIQQGAKVLIVLAQDNKAILPALQKAKDANIPVIAYDRLIEDPTGSVLYLTFDNTNVGKAEAAAIIAKVPKGNYVLIKGDPGDANAKTFLPAGWDQAGLKDKVASGDIKIIGPADGTYTTAWDTKKAQTNMEAIIDAANSSNKKIDAANLNNVALGKQYVDIWKNSNELGKAAGEAALQLCAGKAIKDVAIAVDPSVQPSAGNSPVDFTTPGGNTMKTITLGVTPITADKLKTVMDAGWWATKADICKGVKASDPGGPACQ